MPTTTVINAAGIAYIVGRVRTVRAIMARNDEAAEAARTMHVDSTGRVFAAEVAGTQEGRSVSASAGDEGPFAALHALAAEQVLTINGEDRDERIGKYGNVLSPKSKNKGTGSSKRATTAAAAARQHGHRPMTGAERSAADRRKRAEAAALAEGKSVAAILAERELFLAKRAAKDAEGAVLVAAALAAASSSWDTDD